MKILFTKKTWRLLFWVIVILCLIFLGARGMSNKFKGATLSVVQPFSKTFRIFSGGVSGFFRFLGSIGDLKEENERLIKENNRLLADNALLSDIESENRELRSELELAPRKKYNLEASFVTAQDPQGLGNYLIIDKGANKGIKDGMPVIVSSGILTGRVIEVYPQSAKVVLITDPSSVVNAEVEDSEAKGIIKGEYGLGIVMDMIPQNKVIKEGDRVITSGLGGEMPRGLYVGEVSNVGQSEDKLFQQASIVSPVDFSSLKIVFVIK